MSGAHRSLLPRLAILLCTIQVCGQTADLSLSKGVDASLVDAGDVVSFVLSVTNRGPDLATGITNRDVLPLGLSYLAHSNGVYRPESGDWVVGDLPAAAATSLVLWARVDHVTRGPDLVLHNPKPAQEDFFGRVLAGLDENRVVVSAPAAGGGVMDLGRVYLFDARYGRALELVCPSPRDSDYFGSALSVLGDDHLIVGAPNNFGLTPGIVYVFDTNGAVTLTITNPSPSQYVRFGWSVAGWGTNRIAVGSSEGVLSNTRMGAVHLFDLAGTWLLTITNPTPATGEQFGMALAALDEERLIVGAPGDRVGTNAVGAVYVYDAGGQLLLQVTNPAPAAGAAFGSCVARLGNDRMLVGAPGERQGAMVAGAAYLFSDQGAILHHWANPRPDEADVFGDSVAALGTEEIVVGATLDDHASHDAGMAYIFGTDGLLRSVVPNPFPAESDHFGAAVAALGNQTVVIGCYGANEGADSTGAAYLYRRGWTNLFLENEVVVAAQGEPDPDAANNRARCLLQGGPAGDVAVQLTQSLQETPPGWTNTVVVVVSNAAAGPLTGIRVQTVLGAGLGVATTLLATGYFDSATGWWDIDQLGAGEWARLILGVRVLLPPNAPTWVTNRVQLLSVAQRDAQPGNDQAAANCLLLPTNGTRTLARLEVRSPCGGTLPPLGSYSVVSGQAVTVVLSPAVVTQYPNVFSGSGWRVAAGGTAAGGGTVATVTVAQDMTIEWLWVTSRVFAADLAVSKTADRATALSGEVILYELAVTNRGPDAASGVSVLDVWPPGLGYLYSSNGNYAASNGLWQVGSVPSGGTARLQIAAQAPVVSTSGIVRFLHEPSPGINRYFGSAVAVLDGPYIAVSAPSFGIWLYDTNGALVQRVGATNVGGGFGTALAGHGNRLIVGATNGATGVYSFTLPGSQVIPFANPRPGTLLGQSVAMLPASDVIEGAVIAGAIGDDTGATDAGAVHLFHFNGTSLGIITNPAPAAGDKFGWSVAGLGTDRIVVGCPRDGQAGVWAGVVYVFDRNGALLVTITNPTPSASYDEFGCSVAALGTNRVVVGARGDGGGGSVFLYDLHGALLNAVSNPAPSTATDHFGHSVAVWGEDRILVGAPQSDLGAIDAGVAYLMDTNGAVLRRFMNPAPRDGDSFGSSAAACGPEGAAVGAHMDTSGGDRAGSAYLFLPQPSGTSIVNTVQLLTVAERDPEPTNNQAAALTTMGMSGDVSVSLSATLTEALFRMTNVFRVAVSNAGATAVDSLRFQLELPGGYAFYVLAGGADCGFFDPTVCTWDISRLESGQSCVATCKVRVLLNPASRTSLVVRATCLSMAQADIHPENNQAEMAFSVLAHLSEGTIPLLTIRSDGLPNPVPAPGSYTFPSGTVLTASVASIVVTSYPDQYIPGWTLAGNDPTSGVGTQVIFALTNSASLDWGWVTEHVYVSDLSITKSASTGTVAQGDTILYTLGLSNRGPSTATGVRVHDPLPPGLHYVSNTGDVYESYGYWAAGDLAPGSSTGLTLVARAWPLAGPGRYLRSPAPGTGAGFGSAVAVQGGDRWIVGEPFSTGTLGAAHVFAANGQLLFSVFNPTPKSGDRFGSSLAVLDADRFAVGAYRDDAGATQAGAVHLYSGSTRLATITNPSPATGDSFGFSHCAVGSNRLVVGAYADDTGASNGGTAYIFDDAGLLLVTLTNPAPGAEDRFGYSVAAFGTNAVIVGAPQDSNGGVGPGAAYVYALDGALLAAFTNPAPEGSFGTGVAALGDDRVMVASPAAVKLFIFSTNGVLQQTIGPLDGGSSFGVAPVAGPDGLITVGKNPVFVLNTQGVVVARLSVPVSAGASTLGDSVAVLPGGQVAVGFSGDSFSMAGAGSVPLYDLGRLGSIIVNAARISNLNQYDPQASNQMAMTRTVYGVQGDVAVQLSQSLAEGLPGQTNVLTVVASNAGPTALSGIRVSVALAPQLVGTSYRVLAEGGVVVHPGKNSWDIDELAPGATLAVQWMARLASTSSTPLQLTNEASVVALAQADTWPDNDRAVATMWLLAHPGQRTQPLLTVETPYGTASPPAGQHTFAGGASLVAALASAAVTAAQEVVTCTGWSLTGNEPGSGTGISLSLVLTNDATLRWLWTTSYVFRPHLALSKSVDRAAAQVGEEVNYLITVTNQGWLASPAHTNWDVWPPELQYLSNSNGLFDPASGAWRIPSLAPGTSTGVYVTGRIGDRADPSLSLHNPFAAAADGFGFALCAPSPTRLVVGTPYDNRGSSNDAGQVFVFDETGSQLATLAPPLSAGVIHLGWSLAALDQTRIAVGAPESPSTSKEYGSVFLFDLQGSMLLTITNPAPGLSDRFGIALAALSTQVLAIGSTGEDVGATDAGLVYLYSGAGLPLGVLTNPAPGAGDYFGGALAALGSDGLVVGVPMDDAGGVDVGSVYLFATSGVLRAALTNPSPSSSDYFGCAVATLGADGILVGARGKDVGWAQSGAVYLFGTNGALRTTFTNPTPASAQFFGSSVAVLGTNRVLVAALQDGATLGRSGRAWVFDAGGRLLHTLSDPAPQDMTDFGSCIAGWPDGRVAVGAHQDNAGASESGSAYVFDLDAGGFRIANAVHPEAGMAGSLPGSNGSAAAFTCVGVTGNVAIHKRQTLAEASPGQTNDYVVTASNAGPSVLMGLRIQDSLPPAGLQVLSTTISAGLFDSSTNVWEINYLAPGQAATMTMRTRVTNTSPSVRFLTNTALRVGLAQADTEPADDVASVVLMVVTSAAERTVPQLTIRTPYAGTCTPAAGDYTFPPGTVVTAAIADSTVSVPPHSLRPYGWTLAGNDPTSGVGRQVVMSLTNHAVLNWVWQPSQTNTADLLLGKSVDFTAPTSGQIISYGLVLSNHGPTGATTVAVRDLLPPGVTYVSHSNGSYSAGTGIWSVPTLKAGGSTTLLIRARVTANPSGLKAAIHRASPAPYDYLGIAAAWVTPGLLAAGCIRDDVAGPDAGAVRLFDALGAPAGHLGNPAHGPDDRFSSSLAALEPDRLAVGAYGASGGSGAVHLFQAGGTWLGAISNPVPSADAHFGYALRAFGNTGWVVGAPGAGAAYLFGPAGEFMAAFTNPATTADDFGCAVAGLSGGRVVIGARACDRSFADAGCVYVFQTNGLLLTTITNPAPAAGDQFGHAVAAVGDGAVMVGCPGDDASGAQSGRAFLFAATGDLLAVFTNPAPAAGDCFGHDVAALGSDRIVLSAVGSDADGIDTGVVYIFGTNGQMQIVLRNPVPAAGDYFGWSLATASSNLLAVGAYRDNAGAVDAGSVYVYDLSAAGSGYRIDNAAMIVSRLEFDPEASNDTAWASVVVGASGDMVVRKEQSHDQILVGRTNLYTIIVSNAGAAVMNGIRLREVMPGGLVAIAVQASAGFYDPESCRWEINELAPGTSATLTLQARIDAAAGALTNTVLLEASSLAAAARVTDHAATVLFVLSAQPAPSDVVLLDTGGWPSFSHSQVVHARGTNTWTVWVDYATNLLDPSAWTPAELVNTSWSNGVHTIEFTWPTNAVPAFIRSRQTYP